MQRHHQQQLLVEAAGALVYASKAGPEALQVIGAGPLAVGADYSTSAYKRHSILLIVAKPCKLISCVYKRQFLTPPCLCAGTIALVKNVRLRATALLLLLLLHSLLQEVGRQVLSNASTTAAQKLAAAATAVSKLSATQLSEGVEDLLASPADVPDALLSLLTGGCEGGGWGVCVQQHELYACTC